MGWSIGYDCTYDRDIGYGVPAYCDHPGCGNRIDRGLGYVCGGEPYGGDRGCGLFFCGEHLILHERLPQLCLRCHRSKNPYPAKPDHPEWIAFKLTDESWKRWRKENAGKVKAMGEELKIWMSFKMKFGKYRGDTMKIIYDNDYPYIIWLDSCQIDNETRRAVDAAIEHKNITDP